MRRDRAALVVIDMQNAFCSGRGSFRRRGGTILDLRPVMARAKALVSVARRHRRLVVFTRLVFRPDYSDAGSFLRKFPEIAHFGGYRARSWDAALHPQFTPRKGEIVVAKTGYDAFVRTELEQTLKRRRIGTVIVAGILTNVCVEAFARAAFDRGLQAIVVGDATSTYSAAARDASLRALRRHFGDVVSSARAAALLTRDAT